MKKPDYHILVCNSFRMKGTIQGYCSQHGSASFVPFILDECDDRGLDVAVTPTGCMNLCSQGPIIVIQPNNYWYGGIDSEDKINEILDALEEGKPCEKYLISK